MSAQSTSERISSIDILRGLVMVLMTLDHTRDFFSNAHFSPTDLDKTSLALFLTRWITHFCAPVFVFLAGTSAYLWQSRRGSDAPISRFLLKRGLLVLALTCTVEAFAWDLQHDLRQINAGVLWAIGWSMLVLAGLVKLPVSWIMLIGGCMITLHNAFDGLKAANLDVLGPWWAILHTRDKVQLAADWSIDPYYPLVPWIGVMAVGYGFGKWFSNNQFRSRNHLLALGFTVITAFILLRWTNLYGDPMPWQVYADPAFTVLSFINCHKYPPSLLYLLMTLGPALVILGLLEGQTSLRFAVLQLFGKTPLFFYLIHLYLIHLTALAVAAIKHGPVAVLMRGGIWSPGLPLDYGYDLPVVYIIWLIMLLILYPLCRGFEVLKANKPHWRWLNYL